MRNRLSKKFQAAGEKGVPWVRIPAGRQTPQSILEKGEVLDYKPGEIIAAGNGIRLKPVNGTKLHEEENGKPA
jgi:hypothetical protein